MGGCGGVKWRQLYLNNSKRERELVVVLVLELVEDLNKQPTPHSLNVFFFLVVLAFAVLD